MLLSISCTSTKKTVYFYNVRDTTFLQRGTETQTPIQENDILGISISSLNAEASAIFNPPNTNNIRSTTVTGSNTESGGYITNMILSKKLLVDPLVEIRFLNYEVTVIGEVAKPTVITVPSEKISLLKALGLAGDLTIYGKRENVLLIREENGKKITRHINLNSSNFFNSPYYYLQPNDVVYVSPNKAKVATAGRTTQLLPVILSSLSIVVIVLDRVIK
jgi:polysaccharide biosynthesis/export protein